VRDRALGEPAGEAIVSALALRQWIADNPSARSEGATFVVALDGTLLLAPRRSEHVACASGAPVRCAGELRFSLEHDVAVIEASNQSTGYCPEPDSFDALADALDALSIPRPPRWTHAFIFRRCARCAQLTLVKESVFECAVCGHELPVERGDLA
jgi:hypothetical protein